MPGPDILFVLAVSLERGARQAVSVVLGLCSGLLVHTTAVVCGVAVIIANSPVLFTVIKYFGVAYLTYLGVSAIVAACKKRIRDRADGLNSGGEPAENIAGNDVAAMTNRKFYKRGVMMNLLNPKVLLFFLAFLPGFIDPASDSTAADTIILGAVFTMQALVVFCMVAVLGGALGRTLHIERYTGSLGFAVASASVYFVLALFIAL